MRRIVFILGCIAAVGGLLVAVAGAADKKTYQAELFNAFGLVTGSELRIAGIKAGTITELDTTTEKTALVTFEVGPEFPELKADASCSSEPQSLVSEYFLNCQPGTSTEPLEGPIEAAQNQTTVQNDLVNNILREPFKRRFQLLINEFGTGLVGNAENLNAAIRSGAPALRELSAVLKILGRQNTIIAQLNADSDAVFQQLTDRREDVVRFIHEAEDAGRISAERREDLARDFDLLDDFLFELKPVMTELANLAREQTPLLTDLRAAAPGLNKLGKNLPRFNNASKDSLESLGAASEVGSRAVSKATDEISELNVAAQKAPPAADIVARFLESIDDPANAVEEDCDARYDLREQPGEADRRVQILNQKLGVALDGAQNIGVSPFDPIGCPVGGSVPGNPGYTGLEGLLNYVYVQPAALNLFDGAGHALQIHIVGASSESEPSNSGSPENGANGACGHYYAGPELPAAERYTAGEPDEVPEAADGFTGNPALAVHCAAILGDYQPGVSEGTFSTDPATEGRTQFIPGGSFAEGAPGLLPRHDGSVCPDESTWETICKFNVFTRAGFRGAAPGDVPTAQEQQPTPDEIQDALEQLKKPIKDLDKLREKLGLPPTVPLPPEVTQGVGLGGSSNSSNTGLLNFLLAP
jgi:ABC-type transporter Mla subunit MlaD